MGLTNEHVGPMILAKIKIYVFRRAEILFQVCYETPCIKALLFEFGNDIFTGFKMPRL